MNLTSSVSLIPLALLLGALLALGHLWLLAYTLRPLRLNARDKKKSVASTTLLGLVLRLGLLMVSLGMITLSLGPLALLISLAGYSLSLRCLVGVAALRTAPENSANEPNRDEHQS